jgi:hypothetical protein
MTLYLKFSLTMLLLSRFAVAVNSWTTQLTNTRPKQASRLFVSASSTIADAVASVESTTAATQILADAPDFIQPDRDLRSYRVIRLANNLECLLVSDALREGAIGVEAASVHVQAGHFDDTIPGLAHFHEHVSLL